MSGANDLIFSGAPFNSYTPLSGARSGQVIRVQNNLARAILVRVSRVGCPPEAFVPIPAEAAFDFPERASPEIIWVAFRMGGPVSSFLGVVSEQLNINNAADGP